MQLGSSLVGAATGALAGGNTQSAALGQSVAVTATQNNRLLHPDETKWIEANAKQFAKEQGINEDEATQRLTQQALKDVDYLWRAQLSDGNDQAAQAYLTQSGQTFVNELGQNQVMFTAQGQQLFRPELFADMADPVFYQKFAQSGISRSLSAGLAKELVDSGISLKDSTIDLAKAVAQNPGAAVKGVFNAITALPSAIKDSVIETGQAIAEGSSVAFNQDIQDRLNAIYGVDVSAYQESLLALRFISTATGAVGVAKTGAAVAEKATEAVAKQLDKVLDDAVQKVLLKSGGVFDTSGNALLDLKQLTNDQKRVMGELFGEDTVKQIVPDGEKLARIPGTGETGIDDLYKVNRPDVDYVSIEYKFVGNDTGKGSVNLGSTFDGTQGSESWITGSGRLEKAVEDMAIADSIKNSVKAGRYESWVVTTRPDGSTIVEVLDATGKSKPIDASRILNLETSLSGAKP
jgi:filamentous hemagglutinin